MSREHERYLKALKRKARLTAAVRVLLLALIIGFWELAGRIGAADPFIVSSPARVVRTVASLYSQHDLFPHIAATFLETVAGFAAGTAAGVRSSALRLLYLQNRDNL